jgi:hypothetical protein
MSNGRITKMPSQNDNIQKFHKSIMQNTQIPAGSGLYSVKAV